MNLLIEVCTLIFMYLRLNDLIEISYVCKEFYQICEINHFHVNKLQESMRIFKDRGWLFSHYSRLFYRFYFDLFRQSIR